MRAPLSWLRDFTDLPLGVYPNLGYLSAAGWREVLGTWWQRLRNFRNRPLCGGHRGAAHPAV